jgi:hypothetical protein
LAYAQRAPEDLIEILGQVSDAMINKSKWADARVVVNADSRRRLGLVEPENMVYLQGAPRRCVLREIGFSSARIVLLDTITPQVQDPAVLRFVFDAQEETVDIPGVVREITAVQDAAHISVLDIQYNSSSIPLLYTLNISNHLTRSSRSR